MKKGERDRLLSPVNSLTAGEYIVLQPSREKSACLTRMHSNTKPKTSFFPPAIPSCYLLLSHGAYDSSSFSTYLLVYLEMYLYIIIGRDFKAISGCSHLFLSSVHVSVEGRKKVPARPQRNWKTLSLKSFPSRPWIIEMNKEIAPY